MHSLLMRVVYISSTVLIMTLVFTIVIPLTTQYTLDQDNDPLLSISSPDEIPDSRIPTFCSGPEFGINASIDNSSIVPLLNDSTSSRYFCGLKTSFTHFFLNNYLC
jgi:hypothetical protein